MSRRVSALKWSITSQQKRPRENSGSASLFDFEIAPFAALVLLSMFYTRKLAKKKSALVL